MLGAFDALLKRALHALLHTGVGVHDVPTLCRSGDAGVSLYIISNPESPRKSPTLWTLSLPHRENRHHQQQTQKRPEWSDLPLFASARRPCDFLYESLVKAMKPCPARRARPLQHPAIAHQQRSGAADVPILAIKPEETTNPANTNNTPARQASTCRRMYLQFRRKDSP